MDGKLQGQTESDGVWAIQREIFKSIFDVDIDEWNIDDRIELTTVRHSSKNQRRKALLDEKPV